MNFAYTIVYVADVAASLAFFEQAFGLKRRFLHESGAYGELDTGATPVKAPLTKPWGQTVAYVRCPDGSLVELCTPMG
ncbi:catechol 2,3-dioxygenase-like lactoylglutathione lyase family enzyme [Paucibacter oligotrophus]|uniref:Catechol 2,3-dioxygenase-like lactoylglutathione lyase family enzyme n=1 Tax=Roseateles oligotrophus TaxID=1769250 RepID=A0A840L941_9BURK|nr:hypothetical protein [Roseateles oligotrophus]MBB4843275.1 catechol 2,3-dioxygenase-like lactoylglutathione lyase family enzyme [Roseateles oligotrophus]